jgi:hydrogenase nickel incorporation protein HypA/HybF
MSIALSIIEIATAALPAERADLRVESIHLEIGKLTAVVPSTLRSCFSIAARGTALAGAELDIEEIAVVVGCRECGAESEQSGFPFACTSCESQSVEIVCGRELLVASVEVADA